MAQPKKRIEAQIYSCHIQLAYSNSSLDNVAQMPSPTKKEKTKKELKPKFTYHQQQQQQFLDSLSSQQKNTSSYIFSYPNFLCSSLIRENFKNGVQAFGYHTEFGQGLEYFLQDGLVCRRFDPRRLLQQQQQRQSAKNTHRQGLRPEPQVEFPHEIHRKCQRGGAEPPRARREDQGEEETRQRQRSQRSPRAHQRAPRELRQIIEGRETRELQR